MISLPFKVLKRARDEYYQYVQAQNDIFDEQIKLLDELQTTVCLSTSVFLNRNEFQILSFC